MPQLFNNAVITNAGAQLLTRAQAGEVKIEFTRIAIGDGNYAVEEKAMEVLQQSTKLKSPRNSYAISGKQIISDHCVMVTSLITNFDIGTEEALVSQGYFINEMGLYARPVDSEDETEILYSITVISVDHGDYMPPYNGANPAQIIQEYYVTVDNAENITIQTKMGAVALAEDMEEAFAEIREVRERAFKFGIDNEAFYRGGTEEYEIITDIKASAGSEEIEREDGRALNAIDGDANTYWHTKWSEGAGKADIPNNIRNEFTIDLKSIQRVSKIEYVPRIMPTGDTGGQNGRILRYGLYYSKDGAYFHPLKEGTWENTGDVKSVEFQTIEARKIQIRAYETAGDAAKKDLFICAAEFRIYRMVPGKVYLANLEHEHDVATDKSSGFMSATQVLELQAIKTGKADIDHTHTVVNGHTVNTDVPEGAAFTDTNNICCFMWERMSVSKVDGSTVFVPNETYKSGNADVDISNMEASNGSYDITAFRNIIKIETVIRYTGENKKTDDVYAYGAIGPQVFVEDGNCFYPNRTNTFNLGLSLKNGTEISNTVDILIIVYTE